MLTKPLILIFILLLVTGNRAQAQTDSVILTGQVKDPIKEGNVFICNVIRPGAPLYGQTFYNKSFSTTILNGCFRLAIPSLYDWYDVTLYSVDGLGRQTFYNNGNNLEASFLFQKGDRIDMIIQPGGLIGFSGKAATRLTCQENIYSLHYLPESVLATINYFYRHKRYDAGNDYSLMFLKLQSAVKQKILDAYRDALPLWVYRRFSFDIIGQSYRPLLYALSLRDKDSSAMIAGKRFLPRIETAIAAPDTSAEAVNSSIYTDVLLYEAINEITFSGPGGSMNRTTFSGLFNFVSKNYHGVLRDKLILLTFLNYAGKDPESTNYLGKAFAEMDNDTSKNLLREWAANHLSGAPAYSFDLTDENGRRFTLKDFHGKLIVADFWFYGCGGCAEMPTAMTNVYKKYGQNPKVVFLSINVDTKKATWQSGLKTGQYTIPGSIHLPLLALSRNDPFITYYGYDSYPQLLLIGVNGEIISAYAPDPRADDGKKLIDLIGSHID